MQVASPSGEQYGVGFDGSLFGCVSPLLSLAYNPGENVSPGSRMLEAVDLYTGGLSQNVAGIALPATVPWIVSASYNALAVGGAPNGYQGFGWFQDSQPEIRFYKESGLVHLVISADRYLTYDQIGTGDFYLGIDGAAGFFERVDPIEDVELYASG